MNMINTVEVKDGHTLMFSFLKLLLKSPSLLSAYKKAFYLPRRLKKDEDIRMKVFVSTFICYRGGGGAVLVVSVKLVSFVSLSG